MTIQTPMPEKCPKCESTRIACVRVPGTGWTCTCNECGKNWTRIESVAIPVGSLVVGWFLLCAVFIVSLYYLKKGVT